MRKGNFFNYVISFVFTLLLFGVGKEVSVAAYLEDTASEVNITSQDNADHQRLLAEIESFKQIEESDSDDDLKPTIISGGYISNSVVDFVSLTLFNTLFAGKPEQVLCQALPLFIRFRNLRI